MSLINTFSGSSGGTNYLPVYAAAGIKDYTKEILDGCTKIRRSMFSYDADVVSIEIPEGVTEIGNGAFSGTTSIQSITFPKSLTKINSSCFYTSKIPSIDLSNTSVYSLGTQCFRSCAAVYIKVPETLSTLDTYCFYQETSLLSIDLSNTKIIDIPDNCFYGCINLSSLLLPNSLQTISGTSAIAGCNNLSKIDIPNTITSISGSTFSGGLKTLNVHYKTGSTPYKTGAPWGAIYATVHYIEDV